MRIVALEEHFCTDSALGEPSVRSMVESVLGTGDDSPLLDLATGRLAAMDAAGISVQVLSLVPPGAQEVPGSAGVAMARAENDNLAETVSTGGGRFLGLATLPMRVPDEAAAELRRAIAELGLSGVMIHGHTGGRFLDEDDFAPVLRTASDLGTPIYLHPTLPPAGILDLYYRGVPKRLATSGWGWHADTGLHALRLIVTGVFDRYPQLQVILGHMGEHIPFSLARADERLTPACPHLKKRVADYFCENFYITTSGYFTDPPLVCALATIGADRIMFSVDYPFCDNLDARAWFDQVSLAPSDRRKIAHENADRLLGIPVETA